jgi:hypothetical protein
MKRTKKILKITGITLFVLIALLFLIPVIFKSRILAMVKTEINQSVDARVEFKDLSLSVFSHFPKLTLSLEELSVAGVKQFEGDTLLSTKSLEASVNLWKVIRGEDLEIYGIYLESPRIHALVNKEGAANWDIAKKDTSASEIPADTTASSFAMDLHEYAINNGYIVYEDRTMGMSATIDGLDHTGSGAFMDEVFTLSTKTSSSSARFVYEGIPYLSDAVAGIRAEFEMDNKKGTYSFKDADILVNNLKLKAEGLFRFATDTSYYFDMKFDAPSGDFKEILSLVPALYRSDIEKMKTAGGVKFNGWVKGMYSDSQMPGYDISLDVKDGSFQYPDLPQPVKNIQLSLQVQNPDGVMDHTVANLSKGHLEMGSEQLDFRFLLKNPETLQYLDASLKGRINLAAVSKFIKLDAGTSLAGLVNADAFVKGNIASMQNGQFHAGGFFHINDLYFSSPNLPHPVKNASMKLDLENINGLPDETRVTIRDGHVEFGPDAVDFNLLVTRPVSVVNFAGSAKGAYNLEGAQAFLEAGSSIKGLALADLTFSGTKSAIDAGNYDAIQLNGTAGLKGLQFVSKDYPEGISINNAQLSFTPANITLKGMAGRLGKTNFTAGGTIDHLVGYMMDKQSLVGNLEVYADKLDLNEWMGTTPSTGETAAAPPAPAATASEPFTVPAGIDMTLNAKAGVVNYDGVTYSNINGVVVLKDESVQLKNIRTDALDGQVTFNGSYSTRNDKSKPAVVMAYDIKDVDIQKAFYAYNTVQKLMPLGRFLSGKLSSQLDVTGKLGSDMMPNFNTLTGVGNLFLKEGVLARFAPLEKLSHALQLSDLKEITLKDVKTYVEFSNGKILVKPFHVKVKDIDMQIGGTHGFELDMDYIIAMKIPRKYLGTAGNNLVNGLVAQALTKGVAIELGEIVDLNVRMGGKMNDPTIKTDLKQVTGDATKELKLQATEFVKQKADSARQQVKDSLTAAKKGVVADLKKEAAAQFFAKDSSGTKPSFENTKKNAEATLKNTVGGFLKKKKAAVDSTRN